MSKTEGIIIVFYFYLIFYEQLICIACWSRSMSCLAKSFQQGNIFSKTEYLISLSERVNVCWYCCCWGYCSRGAFGFFHIKKYHVLKKTLGILRGYCQQSPSCAENSKVRGRAVFSGESLLQPVCCGGKMNGAALSLPSLTFIITTTSRPSLSVLICVSQSISLCSLNSSSHHLPHHAMCCVPSLAPVLAPYVCNL